MCQGWTYAALGEYSKAMDDIDRALSLNPGHIGAYKTRSWTKNMLTKFQHALLDVNQAIALAPNDPGSYLHRDGYTAYRAITAGPSLI